MLNDQVVCSYWLFVMLDWVWIWLYAFALSFSLSLFSVFVLPMLLLLLFVCCIPLLRLFSHFNTVILPFLEEYYLNNSFKCIAPLFPPASLLFFQLCSLFTLHALSHIAVLSFPFPSPSSASISPFYFHLLAIDLRFGNPD